MSENKDLSVEEILKEAEAVLKSIDRKSAEAKEKSKALMSRSSRSRLKPLCRNLKKAPLQMPKKRKRLGHMCREKPNPRRSRQTIKPPWCLSFHAKNGKGAEPG